MSEKKHTPEPWIVNSRDGDVWHTVGPGGYIGSFLRECDADRATAHFNACADINPVAVLVMVEALVLIRDHPAATDTIRERCLAALQLAEATP